MVGRGDVAGTSVSSICNLCGSTDIHPDTPTYSYCRECGLVSASGATPWTGLTGLPGSDLPGTGRGRGTGEGGREP
jgi:hypothetical protein